MVDVARIKLVKEQAATKALETYVQYVTEELKGMSLEEIREAFDETGHIREAILVADETPALYVKAGWTFCAHPAVISAALGKAIDQIKT